MPASRKKSPAKKALATKRTNKALAEEREVQDQEQEREGQEQEEREVQEREEQEETRETQEQDQEQKEQEKQEKQEQEQEPTESPDPNQNVKSSEDESALEPYRPKHKPLQAAGVDQHAVEEKRQMELAEERDVHNKRTGDASLAV